MKEKRFSSSGPGCLVGFALLWLGFSVPIFFVAVRDGETLPAIFTAVFVLVGLVILVLGLLGYYTRMRVGKPEILLSSSTLRVGESFTVSFVHSFARSITVDNISLQLIFRETATYQQGTDTRTVTHDHIIDERQEPGGVFQSGSLINQTYEFQIPADGMHNVDVRRNKLQWYLIMKMGVPRLPDFIEQRELEVIPEMI